MNAQRDASYFKQEAEAMSAMLQSGKKDTAKARLNYLWENNVITQAELDQLKTLFAKFGVQIN